MNEGTVFYQVSLIAAFIAGLVSLFAPCCISYLLPAYLSNVFKEKNKILLMTLVYSSGIFVVMMPIVLGAKVLTDFFFDYHSETYIIGGVLLLALAVFSLFGIKLPMPNFRGINKKGSDILSTFTLGVMSGVTSACCAPVLAGVLTLSSLSYSFFGALAVGVAYVFGMVAPLYLAALLTEKGNYLANPYLRKRLFTIRLGTGVYPVQITNLVAFILFFALGVVTLSLVYTGRLNMPEGPSPIITSAAWMVTRWTEKFPWVNALFGVAILYGVYRIASEVRKTKE